MGKHGNVIFPLRFSDTIHTKLSLCTNIPIDIIYVFFEKKVIPILQAG